MRILAAAVILIGVGLAGGTPLEAQERPGCLIKGNISKNGRLYFLPGHPHYERTVIKGDKERWFCSEAEAIAAGWEKAELKRACVHDPLDLVPDPGAPSPDCAVKGNSSGKYHVPGGQCYSETEIRTANRRERWFCSEAEAIAAGYVKSKI